MAKSKWLAFLEIVPLLLLGLIPLLWFEDSQLGLGHDMGFPLAPIDYFIDRTFTWSNMIGSFGSNRTESLGTLSIHGFEAFFYALGFSLVNVQRITFGFWLVAPAISMYILLRSIFPKGNQYVLRISGSLFYGLNHYLLQAWMIAERTKFATMAILPMAILFSINVLRKRKSIMINSLLLSIILSIFNSGVAFPLFVAMMLGWFFSTVILVVMCRGQVLQTAKRAISFLVATLFLYSLFNFYWLFPYFRSLSSNYTSRVAVSGGTQGAVDWSHEISRFTSIDNVIALKGIPDWYLNPEHPYAESFSSDIILICLSLGFTSLVLFGLLRLRTRHGRGHVRHVFLFLSLLIFAIPLAAGSHPPFGFLYDFALRHIPFFVIFRTPYYKFGMILWFSFAVFVGLGLYNLSLVFKRKLFGFVLLFLFFIGVVCYNYPYFTGDFFDFAKHYSTRVVVPSYVFDFKKWVDGNSFFGRVLYFPSLNTGTKVASYDWKYYSLSPISALLFRSPVVVNDVILKGNEQDVVDALYADLAEDGWSNLLRYLNVRSLLYQKDAVFTNDVDVLGEVLDNYVDLNDQFIKDLDFGRWSLYSVGQQDELPLIYSPADIAVVTSSAGGLPLAVAERTFDGSADALYFSDSWVPFGSEYGEMSMHIYEASCLNCEKRRLINVAVAPPRILPGTRLYPVVEFYRRYQLSRISDPIQRIDFYLGDISRKFASLTVLVDEGSAEVVTEVVGDISRELGEINKELLLIDDSFEVSVSDKIYQYLRHIALSSQNIPSDEEGARMTVQFDRLKKLAGDLIVTLPSVDFSYNDPYLQKEYIYNLGLQTDGKYVLSVSSHLPNIDTYEIDLDGNKVVLNREFDGSLRFISEQVYISAGEHRVKVPNYVYGVDFEQIEDLVEIQALPGRSDCKDYYFAENINAKVAYGFKFDYSVSSDGRLTFEVLENVFGVNRLLKAYANFDQYDLHEEGIWSVNGEYYPRPLTKDARLRFCLSTLGFVDSLSEIKNLSVKKFYPAPKLLASIDDEEGEYRQRVKLDFVALNQTKYLVRVKNSPSKYILNLNLRNDEGWKIREVPENLAVRFFSGDNREYLDGDVVEFEKRDSHVLTDFLFPNKKYMNNHKVILNGFSNAWLMDSVSGEGYYLIEYTLQNDFYYSIFVSLISVAVVSFTAVLYVYKRTKKNKS